MTDETRRRLEAMTDSYEAQSPHFGRDRMRQRRSVAADLRAALAEVDRLAAERDEALDHLRDLAGLCDTIDGKLRDERLLAHERAVRAWWREHRFPGTPEAWKTPEERAAFTDPPV